MTEGMRQLVGLGERSPDALDTVVIAALEAKRLAVVDGFQPCGHSGFSSRCRSSASRRPLQYVR